MAEIPPALNELLTNPRAWPRARILRFAEFTAALADPRLSAETRDGVLEDLEAIGALAYMERHPELALGDVVALLTSTEN